MSEEAKKWPLDGIERICQVPLNEMQLQALLRHERVIIQAGSILVHVLLKPDVTWEQALYAVAVAPEKGWPRSSKLRPGGTVAQPGEVLRSAAGGTAD